MGSFRNCVLLVLLSVNSIYVYGEICEKTVTVATYNTGLSSRLASYEIRRKLIPRAIANIDADVICLQELWFEDDLERVIEASAYDKPFFYSSLHMSNGQYREKKKSFWSKTLSAFSNPPCLSWRLLPFLTCQMWNCRGKGEMDLLQCMEKHCVTYLNGVPQDCITCLVVGYADVETGFSRCGSMFHGYKRFNTQGLLLLSRKRIISARKRTYITKPVKQILPRGYIHAEIEDVGTVVCTHLTTNVSSTKFEYNLKYATPGDKQADELRMLHEKFKHNQNHIIMGDLNMGPLSVERNLWGDFPKNYQKMKKVYGYTSVYEENNGTCTYCTYNTVQNNSTRNKLLDHILIKGQSYRNTKRIFTKRKSGSHLSDHFGIQVDICVNP